MAETRARGNVWEFDHVVLDGAALELRVHGEVVSLEPKALGVLLTLLQHPGEVLTKQELLDAVWPGRVVTEGVLTKAVSKLRTALRDTDQQLVRSAHGHGYRLVADVRVRAATRDDDDAASALAFDPGALVPRRPNWRLQRRLAEGGQGEVWLAQHEKTRERRVFKFSRDEHGLTALKREITLFRLLHDALGERREFVPLLDWNLEEPPYFIESAWAPDGSLLDWSDRIGGVQTVPLAQRLGVVATVCDALAAAHGVGVLHKDLKPANILIETDGDGVPQARLGDFGSGRILDPGQLDAMGITRLGYTRTQALESGPTSGTPLYLAPEVIAGHAPTVRSDLYAMGVVLYQLVVGDLRRPLAPGWERDVDDVLLREDIAACVDGDPARRLDNAAALAQRLRSLETRHAQRALDASIDAERERLRAALASARVRRRWLLALVAVLGIGLLASGVLLVQWRDAQREATAHAERADRQAANADAVNRFLLDDLIAYADPFKTGEGDVTVKEAIAGATARIAERFADQPDNEAAVRRAIAVTLIGAGEFDRAEEQLQAALAALDGSTGDTGAMRLDVTGQLAEVRFAQGRYEDARALLGDPDTIAVAAGGTEAQFHRAWLSAYTELRLQRTDRAVALFDALLAAARAHYGDADGSTLMIARNRAEALTQAGRLPDARAALLEAYRQAQALYGADNVALATYLHTLAVVEAKLGLYDDELARMRDVVRIYSAHLPPHHRGLVSARVSLADALVRDQQLEEAIALLQRAVADGREGLGPAHQVTLLAQGDLASTLGKVKRTDEALALARDTAAAWAATVPPTHTYALGQRHQTAMVLQHAGRWEEANAEQTALLALAEGVYAPTHSRLAHMRAAWGETLLALGRTDVAQAQLDLALPPMRAGMGENHPLAQRFQAMRDGMGGTADRTASGGASGQ